MKCRWVMKSIDGRSRACDGSAKMYYVEVHELGSWRAHSNPMDHLQKSVLLCRSHQKELVTRINDLFVEESRKEGYAKDAGSKVQDTVRETQGREPRRPAK